MPVARVAKRTREERGRLEAEARSVAGLTTVTTKTPTTDTLLGITKTMTSIPMA